MLQKIRINTQIGKTVERIPDLLYILIAHGWLLENLTTFTDTKLLAWTNSFFIKRH